MVKNNPFNFSTKFSDNESGLQWFGYRYLTPSAGRWLSRDPLEEVGGANLYAFLSDSPVTHVDPLGAFSLAEEGVVGDVEGGMIAQAADGAMQALSIYNRVKSAVDLYNDVQKITVEGSDRRKLCGLRLTSERGRSNPRSMPRKLRVEYPGAMYHVMSRGDHTSVTH